MPQRQKILKESLLGVGIGCAAAVITLMIWSMGWFEKWERHTWDWRVSVMAKPSAATDDIVVVLLDQNSLDWGFTQMGLTWPWPREIYSVLVDFCKRNQARSLAFDVLYTEPSKYGVVDDIVLGKAMAKFGRTVTPLFLSQTSGSLIRWPDNISKPGFTVSGLDQYLERTNNQGLKFLRAIMPVDEIAENTAVLCNVNNSPSADGIYREMQAVTVFDNTIVPSLGLGSYMAEHPDAEISFQKDFIDINGYEIPTDEQGSSILRFRGPSGTHATFSAASVIQSEIRLRNNEKPTITDLNAFKDKYVFFGFSAPGLFDLKVSPVDGLCPGVEIHATLLDNFLSQDFIQPSPFWFFSLFILGLTCSGGSLLCVFSKPVTGGFISLGFFVIPVGFGLIAYAKGYWLPMAAPEAALVLTISLAQIINYATLGRQKRFIKNAFRHYLHPQVIDQIIEHPEKLKLGGERRIMTIFFSDIQGFTAISEKLEPEVLTQFLNQYLTAMTDIIQDEGGTIDKYEGDAIIAFWNAPLEMPDHPVKSVRAALRCQQKLTRMRPEFNRQIGGNIYARIGINTGPAIVGNMGSNKRFDYTVIGDTVNLASRLEGVNKQFGTYIMISKATLEMLGDTFAKREVGRITVKGRNEPVRVFEPMYHEEYERQIEMMTKFHEGLEGFYVGDFEKTIRILQPFEKTDPVSSAYIQKSKEMLALPVEKRTFIWVMTQK